MHTVPDRPQLSQLARWRRILTRFVLGFFAFSLISVLTLRWVPPLFSTLMLEKELRAWMSDQHRSFRYQWVSLDQINPLAVVAVVAAEDQLFAEHHGFDWGAIKKAFEHNQRHHRIKGASTISQQTVKNLFLWSERSWVRKGLEVYFTLLIELLWSKERIIEVYLNVAELGDGVYGVEAAAQAYLHKSAAALSGREAALFAAVLPNPRRYSIKAPSAYVRERQAWILRQMNQLGGKRYRESLG